jgi:hypothetical protein
MARLLNLLSPKFVETIDRPGRFADGGGLYLQVTAGKNGGVTKSWLFRYMRGHVSRNGKPLSRELELFDKRVLLTTAERPRGATVFNDLVSDPPTTEQEFVGLWKLYIVTIVAQKIREFGVSGTEFEKLISTLEGQGLLDIDSDLARVFKSVRRYVSRWFKPKIIEGSMAIDPTTFIPTIAGKITPGEPEVDERSKGAMSVDKLAELVNAALEQSNYQIWVLLDRLDVAFVESHDLEKNALRALFRVYRDFANFDRIKLKIFLRSDIWDRMGTGGFAKLAT